MLQSERDEQEKWLEELAREHGRDRGALIPILQSMQARYSQIDEHSMQVIADLLGIHPVEVQSVVSFYDFLEYEPAGRFVIRLCRMVSCDQRARAQVARQLENDLGIRFGETTGDRMFTLKWVSCLGMCDQGPAMLINDKVHTCVTPEKVHQLLAECRNSFGLYAGAKEH